MSLRFYRIARWAWWRLPAGLRDYLRPRLFPPAGVTAALTRRIRPPEPAPVRRRSSTARGARRPFPFVPQTVSVLIPTLDAGPLFHRVLASIGRQSGLGGVEVVVVDSGSTDGTPETAVAAGARVVRIDRDEFGHGRTRNLAAELATGDMFVLMVQDAILLGPDALRALVVELHESPRVAAVSARQVPRSDADLYGAFAIWAHERVIWNMHRATEGRALSSLTPLELRAAATVDNVCAAVRSAAWRSLRFADVEFAEDLDFGLRALEEGWTVGLSEAAAVAHSHTRDAGYCFRRGVADRLHVSLMIGEDPVRAAACGTDALHAASRRLIEEVEGSLACLPREDAPLATHVRALRSALRDSPVPRPPTGELQLLADAVRPGGDVDFGPALTPLRGDLDDVLGWVVLDEYARAQQRVSPDEFSPFAAKITASVLARALGDAARRERDPVRARPLLQGV